jgi:hypothetical protein
MQRCHRGNSVQSQEGTPSAGLRLRRAAIGKLQNVLGPDSATTSLSQAGKRRCSTGLECRDPKNTGLKPKGFVKETLAFAL